LFLEIGAVSFPSLRCSTLYISYSSVVTIIIQKQFFKYVLDFVDIVCHSQGSVSVRIKICSGKKSCCFLAILQIRTGGYFLLAIKERFDYFSAGIKFEALININGLQLLFFLGMNSVV